MSELLLLVFVWRSKHDDEAHALAWANTPPNFSFSGHTLADVDLGDWECKDLPTSVPSEQGLWLLRWAWEPTEDEWGGDTVRYADVCVWSRPTVQDLFALGALPLARDGGVNG